MLMMLTKNPQSRQPAQEPSTVVLFPGSLRDFLTHARTTKSKEARVTNRMNEEAHENCHKT
jgi:hypothetical protein